MADYLTVLQAAGPSLLFLELARQLPSWPGKGSPAPTQLCRRSFLWVLRGALGSSTDASHPDHLCHAGLLQPSPGPPMSLGLVATGRALIWVLSPVPAWTVASSNTKHYCLLSKNCP